MGCTPHTRPEIAPPAHLLPHNRPLLGPQTLICPHLLSPCERVVVFAIPTRVACCLFSRAFPRSHRYAGAPHPQPPMWRLPPLPGAATTSPPPRRCCAARNPGSVSMNLFYSHNAHNRELPRQADTCCDLCLLSLKTAWATGPVRGNNQEAIALLKAQKYITPGHCPHPPTRRECGKRLTAPVWPAPTQPSRRMPQ